MARCFGRYALRVADRVDGKVNDPLDENHQMSVLLIRAIREHVDFLHEQVQEWKPRPYPGRKQRIRQHKPFIIWPGELRT